MAYFYKENLILESELNQYFNTLSDYNEEKFNGELSIILLGSLSRNEATWIGDNNSPILLSDIEYFTVYPTGFDRFSEFEDYSNSVAKEIFKSQNSTLFHIDNTFVKRESLSLMERKLLTFDALKMGKCVMGKNDLERLPDITLENINLWDIKDILTHRVFSALYYGLPLKIENKTDEYRYCLAKNSLDLMTVMLVSNGILESGFINRLKLIKELPIDENIKNYFDFCLSLKLSYECDFDFTIEEMENIFILLVRDLYKNFKIPFKNMFINRKHVTKRILGIVKRGIKYRHIPSFNHLNNLINYFENKKIINKKQLKDNLVINGYPVN